MIAWLSLVGVLVVTAVAVWRVRSRRRPPRRDPDWGDWPPDQMAT